MAKRKISCVIPCYRSSHMIGEVVDLLEETIAQRKDEFDHEIILVNDASPDDTIGALRKIAEKNPNVVVVDLARNFGQHPALMAGFAEVSGDIVVVLDDDMQCPPQELFKLVDTLIEEDKDIVYAYYSHREHAGWRNLGSRFNTWCVHRFSRVPKDLQINNYYAVKRFVIDNALRYKNPYPYIDGLLMQSVRTYANVEITHHAREEGHSGYNMRSLVSQWTDGVTLFSIYPLRIATVTGFIFAIVGFIFAVVVIIEKIIDPTITEGWSSLMAALLFIGGIIVFVVGMVGEYVGRLYLSSNNMPQYVVRNVIDRREAPVSHGWTEDFMHEDARTPPADSTPRSADGSPRS